jgi:hypothetical protein
LNCLSNAHVLAQACRPAFLCNKLQLLEGFAFGSELPAVSIAPYNSCAAAFNHFYCVFAAEPFGSWRVALFFRFVQFV